MNEWRSWRDKFVHKEGEESFVLKLKDSAYDEEIRSSLLVNHANVSLEEVVGWSTRSEKGRILGYRIKFWNDEDPPIIHHHTWYVTICFSDMQTIGRKPILPLYTNKEILLLRVGVGVFDYHFLYRRKTRDHDRAGYSDGVSHIITADNWKDGL